MNICGKMEEQSWGGRWWGWRTTLNQSSQPVNGSMVMTRRKLFSVNRGGSPDWGGEKGRKCYLSDKRQEPGKNGPYQLWLYQYIERTLEIWFSLLESPNYYISNEYSIDTYWTYKYINDLTGLWESYFCTMTRIQFMTWTTHTEGRSWVFASLCSCGA